MGKERWPGQAEGLQGLESQVRYLHSRFMISSHDNVAVSCLRFFRVAQLLVQTKALSCMQVTLIYLCTCSPSKLVPGRLHRMSVDYQRH